MNIVDMRPVYEDLSKKPFFDEAAYFYVNFQSDCAICLEYQKDPYIIPCGHVFCNGCLETAKNNDFGNKCCICLQKYTKNPKPVKFFFVTEIKTHILFKKVTTNAVLQSKSFFNTPFATSFVLKGNRIPNENYSFYQSADGQLYFLHPLQFKALESKPEYFYVKIKQLQETSGNENKFNEFKHVEKLQKFYIVTVFGIPINYTKK
ncbi:hypothetical protein NUSPORA_01007 [Nucleospora cyclopteri]